MSISSTYNPGPADIATIEKDGDNWTLVVVREFRHSPERVWQALTDPAELREWAPYDADKNLGVAGAVATLVTIGAPGGYSCETTVSRAEEPNLLEFKWGKFDTRWKLEPLGEGTRLTLWINIDKPFIAMGAAGWQVCFDVMDHLLSGNPIGRLTGPDAMHSEGWQRLYKEYADKFGVAMPKW